MSYSCSISFKQLKGDEVFSFFQRFKELTLNHFDDIAEENFTFSPLFKNYRVVSGEHL